MLHKEGYRQLKIHCVVRWEKKEVGYEWRIHSPPWRKELSLTFLGGEQTSRCHLKVVKAIICPPALHHLLLLHRQSMTRTFQKKPGNFSRHCTQDLALRDISPFSHDLPAPTMTSAVATQLQPAGHKFYHSFMCRPCAQRLVSVVRGTRHFLGDAPLIFLCSEHEPKAGVVP